MLKVLYSPAFLEHKPPFPHPERPERLRIALSSLKRGNLPIEVEEPPSARIEDLYIVHDANYVKRIDEYVRKGVPLLDADTYLSRGTMKAALKAAGASLKAVKLALENHPSFSLPRPPGHHAGRRGRALGAPTQGFCIFNNAALAVAELLASGFKRVAVVDFDAHHGNGTQEIFNSDPRVLQIDLHEDPITLYPGTGFPVELGEGEGEGYKVNIILPPGSGDDVYREAVESIVIPLLESFKPEVLVFSAGFDAYEDDGLSHLRAGEGAYSVLGSLPRELKLRRVLSILEGGYDTGLARGLPVFAAELVGVEAPKVGQTVSSEAIRSLASEYFKELKSLLRKYWSF